MNEKKKGKLKINIMDILIILLILAIAAVVLYLTVFQKDESEVTGNVEKIRYVLRAGEIRNEIVSNIDDKINPGDAVYDVSTGKKIGTIAAIDTKQSSKTLENIVEGKQVLSEIPEKTDVYITIDAVAELNGTTYVIDGSKITIGRAISIRVPDFTAKAVCINVREIV